MRENTARILGALRALLTREDWVYILGLLLPLILYDVALKTSRVVGLLGAPGPLEFVDQVRSELLFGLGYLALWVGVFAVARRGVPRLLTLVLFHLMVVVDATLTTGAHYFYETTGSVLDYEMVAYSLSAWQEIWPIVTTEATSAHWLLLAAVLSYALAGPAILVRLFGSLRWRGSPRRRAPAASSSLGVRIVSVVLCLAAATLGTLSLVPSTSGASSKPFARDALANMLATEFEKLRFERANPEVETEFAAESLPTDATLVETPKTARRNVVMVLLESTRASATTPYNEDLKTTPFLTELAANSLLVEDAYAVVPHTSKALVAGNCGVTPPLDTKNSEANPGAIPARCLPELLENQGYATAFFQSATEDFERRRELVENLGYEDFFPLETLPLEGFEQANYFGYEDDVMLGPSEEWIAEQKNAGKPFMTSYLTVTPHHDYVVPKRHKKEKFVEKNRLNRYLNTVRYEDFFLRNLFEQYRELGLYEDTIFVIVGDHGEGFGEHDRWQHNNVIYEEGLKVPMLVHDPRRFAGGARVEGPANQLDLLPTLAGLLGYGITGGVYPGSPLYALPEDRLIAASCYHEHSCMASVKGKEKYVYHFGNQEDELFDLEDDPRERKNLAEEEAGEIEERRDELLAWRSKVEAIYARRSDGSRETAETEG